MAWLLRMPEVAANATDAVLGGWSVSEKQEFVTGDTLATVETDKAMVDVEAESDGVVVSTLVPDGARVEVGAPIAVLGEPGEEPDDLDALMAELGVAPSGTVVMAERRDVPDADPGSGAPVVDEQPAVEEEAAVEKQAPVEQAAVADPPTPESATGPRGRVFSSPLARKLAREAGLALEDLRGTGPRNRVLRRDVEAAVAGRESAAAQHPVDERPVQDRPAVSATGSDVPHSRLRRAVAERLQESKREAPHFYLRASVRAERLLALRAEVNGDGDAPRVSVNDLVLKAVAGAHRRVPEMNAVWLPDVVRTFEQVDVAVAVATDRGLLTPVVRDVGSLSLTDVASRTRDLAERARSGRLQQSELEGGSISVSNLGMYGVEDFAAIINPPHAAILAVGAVRDEPVVEDGAVVPGKVMRVSVSVDHRPVDGAVAARWLGVLTELLEHPVRMLV